MSGESRAQSVERRKYYRIDDVVLLRYEVLGEGATVRAAAAEDSGEALATIDRQLNPLINAVWREHPPVAEALGLINRKLSLIAARLAEASGADPGDYAESRVNISGCGIAFEVEQEIALGTRLQLFIVLQPSRVTVTITGTVVGSEACVGGGDAPFRVRVDFDEDLQAQEQLIQHVVQKQAALLAVEADDAPPPDRH